MTNAHPPLAQQAQRLLERVAGCPLTLRLSGAIAGFPHVFRAELASAPTGWSRRMILKTPQRSKRRARLLNHAAGLALLTALPAPAHRFPHLLAVDDELPLVVATEVEGSTLQDIVAAGDAMQIAEALVDAARATGQIQAAAKGHSTTYDRLRLPYGPPDPAPTRDPNTFLRQSYSALEQLCTALALRSDDAKREYYALVDALEQPGPFTTYTIYDHHAANWVQASTGLAIVDLDWGAYRLGLLDLVVLRVLDVAPDVFTVAPPVLGQMEAVYRAELRATVPEAGDDAAFADACVAASSYWALFYVVGYGVRVLDQASAPYDLWARRQMLRALADNATLAPRSRRWPALRDLLRAHRGAA